MDLQEEMNELQNKLASGISRIIRSINDREKTVEFLRNMNPQPTIDILKRINKIAFENEDYETCDAIVRWL